jgi:hypothetical protein
MTIGSIVVDLLARTGSFETDLNRAAKQAEKRAKEIDAAVSKAGAAVGTALGAAGIAAAYFGKQLIDGLDALNDVADATGASIENISALENVAMRTGSSMDTVTGTLVKFNNVLKEVDGKNAASQALKALGLDAQELKRIDPADALHRTAVALAGFADDGNKARLVQELFGKSIREVAPLLKDLAEKTELVGTVSAEQAANAEIFNKQIFAMKANATEAARSIVGDLLPALNQFLRNAADIKKMGGFGLIVKDAAKPRPDDRRQRRRHQTPHGGARQAAVRIGQGVPAPCARERQPQGRHRRVEPLSGLASDEATQRDRAGEHGTGFR